MLSLLQGRSHQDGHICPIALPSGHIAGPPASYSSYFRPEGHLFSSYSSLLISGRPGICLAFIVYACPIFHPCEIPVFEPTANGFHVAVAPPPTTEAATLAMGGGREGEGVEGEEEKDIFPVGTTSMPVSDRIVRASISAFKRWKERIRSWQSISLLGSTPLQICYPVP